jgi:hypothetical protein
MDKIRENFQPNKESAPPDSVKEQESVRPEVT